jgi:hypothetical protein
MAAGTQQIRLVALLLLVINPPTAAVLRSMPGFRGGPLNPAKAPTCGAGASKQTPDNRLVNA